MSDQGENASEVDEAENAVRVTLPARHQTAEVMQLGEQSFGRPAPQRPAMLGALPTIGAVGCNQLDAVFQRPFIQPIAVAGQVADQPHRRLDHEAPVERGRDQGRLVGRRTRHGRGERKTVAVRPATSLVPLPCLVVPTCASLFFRSESAVEAALLKLDAPRSCRSWTSASSTSRSAAARTHCLKRRRQV